MKNDHGGILLCAAVLLHGVRVVVGLGKTKRNGGSDISKPPLQMGVSNGLLYDGFFLLPSCGSFYINIGNIMRS